MARPDFAKLYTVELFSPGSPGGTFRRFDTLASAREAFAAEVAKGSWWWVNLTRKDKLRRLTYMDHWERELTPAEAEARKVDALV